ncbi:MAG: hypothetical protein R3228_03340 [Halioglobus sp.]|nr:hypothetical protein [Halioglobus sp.]
MAEQAKKAAPKRKPAAKRKPAPKRKPAAKRAAPKKKPAADFSSRAQEAGRNAFLAGLGFYGKAFDQAQDRLDNLQSDMEARRKKADKVYKELVKRGMKVEKDAQKALDDLELDSLTDRKKLESQLKKAKARFEELRESVGFKSAA